MKRFLIKKRRYIIGTVLGIVFTITMIHDVPSWVLGSLVQKYSAGRLKFYDTRGTFWSGSGLLVAMGAKLQTSAPILLLNWNIKLGMKKFIDIDFDVGNKRIAEFYIDKTGSNLDKLDLSMSITQVEKLFDIIKDMSISGNVNVSAEHISIGKKMKGSFTLTLDNISSGISRVNPLGSYIVTLSTETSQIEVSTKGGGSVLTLEGNGSTNNLVLEGRIKEDSKEDMMQFITLMGIPKANGAYQLKIF